jgi:hypothetical protein
VANLVEIQSQNLNRVTTNAAMHFDCFLVGEADGCVPQGIGEALLITDADTQLHSSLSLCLLHFPEQFISYINVVVL